MTLFGIFGVSPDRVLAEITPVQKDQQQKLREESQVDKIKQFLIKEQHIPENQVHVKRTRKSDEARNLVNLSIIDSLSAERITSYGLRYALLMVACYFMAKGEYWPQVPERD